MRLLPVLFLMACGYEPTTEALTESTEVCQQATNRKLTTFPLDECAENVAFLRGYTGDEVFPCMAMNREAYCQPLDNGDVQTYSRGLLVTKLYPVSMDMEMTPVVY